MNRILLFILFSTITNFIQAQKIENDTNSLNIIIDKNVLNAEDENENEIIKLWSNYLNSGEYKMKKVLIAYASRTGNTEKMAEYIADINRKVQNDRLSELNKSLNEVIAANSRAVELLVDIISSNPKRMLLGKENIVIRGDLATYCVPIEPILNRLKSPFSNSETGFDTVEVHPKDHFVRQEARACIQVDAEEHIPSGDVIASYLLGLSNDMATWTKPNMRPLRDALLQTYGLTTSPISKPLIESATQILLSLSFQAYLIFSNFECVNS